MMTMRGRIVLPGGIIPDGVVQVRGDRITAVGPATDFPEGGIPDASDDLILPGLVDVHCHGGGGASFPDAANRAEAMVAVLEHRRHGTTTLVASLVTAPPQRLRDQVGLLATLAAAGEIAGIHLEGPFISAAHRGAQDPDAITAPDPGLTEELARLADGHLVSMTIAPECHGAVEVATRLLVHGAFPSWGHTSATAAEAAATLRAVGEGHATVTHLYNGMAPLHHRQPGPILEFLAAARQGRLTVELIGDGVHLDPATVRATVEIVGPDNAVLVTDAMAGAGMADGDYQLGGHDVAVRDGVARLADGGALAGGTAHLLDVVRATVAGGVPLVDAVSMASAVPARLLGRGDIGVLAVDMRADILVTDTDLAVKGVFRHGVLVR